MPIAKQQFFIRVMAEIQGPFSSGQLKELASSGKLQPDSHVRKGRDGNWKMAETIKGLSFNRLTQPLKSEVASFTKERPNREHVTWTAVAGVCTFSFVAISTIWLLSSGASNTNLGSPPIANQSEPDSFESDLPAAPEHLQIAEQQTHPSAQSTVEPKSPSPIPSQLDAPRNSESRNDAPKIVLLPRILSILRHGERSALKHVHVKMQDNENLIICFRIKDGKYLIGNERKPEYYGQILDDGTWVQPGFLKTDIVSIVSQIEYDPIAYAKEHGYKTGRCCFCSRKLTDPKSVSAGYGPVCAEHYGLPWGQD